MIWKGTKAELLIFIKELNEKHKTIKSDFQISPSKVAFLDTIFTVTYNRKLSDISKIVNTNWNIVRINTEFHGVF